MSFIYTCSSPPRFVFNLYINLCHNDTKREEEALVLFKHLAYARHFILISQNIVVKYISSRAKLAGFKSTLTFSTCLNLCNYLTSCAIFSLPPNANHNLNYLYDIVGGI